MNVEKLLSWGEKRTVTLSAKDQDFWREWRANKDALKSAGVSVKPGPNGTWVARYAPRYSSSNAPANVERRALAPSAMFAWSPEQSAIFEEFRSGISNVIVWARAGTGKTTTIKAAFEVAPEARMLYAIFGKRNEQEAKEKITDPRVEIKTLHALGYSFISRVWTKLVVDKEVEIDRILSLCGKDTPDEVIGQLERLVGFVKNTTINPSLGEVMDIADERDVACDAFVEEQFGGWTVEKLSECALAVLELSKTRDAQNRISFNDMVWLPVAMNWVRPWFDLVVVDEMQDMNMPQLQMAKLAVKKGGRLVGVGDDHQAIYAFRGAVSNGMAIMERDLNAKRLGLTVTRRCPKSHVRLAQEFVPDFKSADDAPEGEIDSCMLSDVSTKARIGDAILSRANAPLMPICLALLRKGVRARIEGRDVAAMLLNIVKSLKAKSVPDFLARVEKWGAKMRKRLEGRKNAESKISVINDQVETLTAVAEGLASISEVISRLESLFQDSDKERTPCVILSSVHKAKGLEWDRVFLVRSTFLRRSRGDSGPRPQNAQEEENIYYVALTRSKSYLCFITEPPTVKVPVASEPAKN